MKTLLRRLQIVAAALFFCVCVPTPLRAQGTAFTYQGKLTFSGSPVNGSFDFQFILFQYVQYGFPASPVVTNLAVPVTNGLFTTTIDFGSGIFNGSNYWLDISVRTNNGGQFIELAPRQPVTPSPYSVFANTASNLSGLLPVSQLSGTVQLSQLPPGIITNNQSGNVNFNGTVSGNGSGLYNLQLTALGVPGTFTSSPLYFQGGVPYQVGQTPYYATVTDVNGDGKPDIVTTTSLGMVILTNNGAGIFTSNSLVAVSGGADSIAVVTNVDGNGHMALIAASSSGTLTIATNNGTATFNVSQTITGVSQAEWVATIPNFDSLGHTAIVSANAGSSNMTIFTSNGSGVFTTNATINTGGRPFYIAVADVNGDGKPDLIVNDFTPSYQLVIFTNNGGGIFSSNSTITAWAGGYAIATADVNGDGKVDLIMANYTLTGWLTVYTNNGSGVFNVNNYWEVGQAPTFVVAADVNGDGKPDLISANYYGGTLTVLTNDGKANFGFYQTVTVGSGFNTCSAGDLNADGRTDLIVPNHSGVSVFLNLASPINGLGVNGTINSPMWQVNSVFNSQGPLYGQGGSFYSNGGTLLIFVSGSGFSTTNGMQIGVDVKLDGTPIDFCGIYVNNANVHQAFVPVMTRVGAGPGLHNIVLSPHAGTSTDNNDIYRVTVQELPF